MIYKGIETENCVIKLENGSVLLIYDGYAKGSDGKIYHCVEREIGEGE